MKKISAERIIVVLAFIGLLVNIVWEWSSVFGGVN
jgi:hypothetical protein